MDFFDEMVAVDVGQPIAAGARPFGVVGAIIFAFDTFQVMLDGRQRIEIEQGGANRFMADDFVTRVRPGEIPINRANVLRVNIFVKLEMSHRQADQLNERLVVMQDLIHGISSSNTVYDKAGIQRAF
jgi:hypothetical protein